jgi:hypothetical protein
MVVDSECLVCLRSASYARFSFRRHSYCITVYDYSRTHLNRMKVNTFTTITVCFVYSRISKASLRLALLDLLGKKLSNLN